MMKRQLQAAVFGLALSSPLIVASVVAQERTLVCVETREGEKLWLKCVPPMASPSPSPSPTASPEPTPVPTPSPTSSPTPSPSPAGRVGGGWQTVGGAGCPKGRCGDVYHVTTLADSGPGSFRNGVGNRSGPRTIVFDVAGTISLRNPQVQIRAPYLTIDGLSAPAPGITLQDAQCDPERMMGILSTHDVIVRGIRAKGCWKPGDVEHNWETLFADGDVGPDSIPWDDEAPRQCNRRLYLSNNTFIDAMNDIGGVWCCAEGVTIVDNLTAMSYHPHTTGCKGWRAKTDPESKHNVSFVRNAYAFNGERQPIIREGCYDCDVVNDVVYSWQNYSGLDPQGSGPGGYGMRIADSPNWGLNVLGNAFLAGMSHYERVGGIIKLVPGAWRPAWDCVMNSDPGSPIGPREDKQHYSDNLFTAPHNPRHCKSTPGGEVKFRRDYPLPALMVSALEAVITAAGMPWPDARELALKAEVLTAYRARVGQ